MTTEPQKQVTVIEQICTAVDKMKTSLADRLEGTGVSPERFMLTVKTAVQSHNDRKGIENADRQSLFLAIQKSAGDGLLLDNREAALVVYNVNIAEKNQPDKWIKQVNYQPMVQGLIKLARNSGEMLKVSANVVYEKDFFEFNPATMEIPNFNPNWFGDRGKPVGVWSMIKLKSGEYLNEMFTADQIKRKAAASKVPKNYEITSRDFEEWWKKMAIRNILKYAPRTTTLDKALERDNEEFILEENPQSPSAETPPANPVIETPRTNTRAAAVIKAANKAPEKAAVPPSQPEPQSNVIDGEYTDTTGQDTAEEEEIPV